MEKELLDKIAEILEVDTIHTTDELNSFDEWDSLTGLSIMALVYSDYNKTLSNNQLKEFVTVDDLITYILN